MAGIFLAATTNHYFIAAVWALLGILATVSLTLDADD